MRFFVCTLEWIFPTDYSDQDQNDGNNQEDMDITSQCINTDESKKPENK